MKYIIENYIPINIHIVDTNATIKENDIVACAEDKNKEYFGISRVEDKELGKYPEQYAWCYDTDLSKFDYQFWCVKIIATTDQSLDLPLLSKQAINTIIEHNGIIEDFDIEIYDNYDTHECIANIILPTTGIENIPIETITCSKEQVLNIIDFIINNARIEDRDLFINYQLLNSEQVLQRYLNR
jgi:hypothetical protein